MCGETRRGVSDHRTPRASITRTAMLAAQTRVMIVWQEIRGYSREI